MANREFVHLHLHTDYSLLDGACAIYHKEKHKVDLVKLAKEFHMPAIAITDHGVMGGAIDFYTNLTANAIKPIIGCEIYVSPTKYNDRNQNTPHIKGYHLILLAKDFEGYHNLCKLDSIANLDGLYYKPRIDKELLAKYSKGLIGLSACLHGEVPFKILEGDIKGAKSALKTYVDILGKDNFYLEIMDHGLEEQKKVNKELLLLSREFNIPVVATNDAHYLKREYSKSHELLLCVQTNSTMNDPKRFKFSSEEFYFKSPDEMFELFKDVPEAISNTLKIAEQCNLKIPFVPEVNHYPVYHELKNHKTQKDYLKEICLEGIEERYGFSPYKEEKDLKEEEKAIIDRLDYELGVIDKSKYCSYFLVVWDFLAYARKNKIPVGPGRGSGAGSIVAYLSYITDIDPLKYQLLFERFLNPERVSPPDFDIDFCERRRSEVIEYVRKKYGSKNVSQIGTYGTLKAKNVIKDIGRALGYSFDQRNMITKLMPSNPDLTLASSRENNDELNNLAKKEPWIDEIFMYAEPLEGLNRNMSIHAAGVIIGDQEISNLVPLTRGSGDEVITQYQAPECEKLGLLKMDFLGLKTLTIIQDTLDFVKNTRGLDIDISKISLEDEKAFELLNRGDTIAVFQLESGGMRDLCKRFGVSKIEDITALIALYRPGPMQFIGDFINRKSGKIKVEYDHPKMEEVLKETYGIMLYQEQIMQVVQVLAGFTLGGADILRRAIGKKKIDELMAQKKKFVDGCATYSNISAEKAEAIWDKIEMFAGYGFNKSHSAAYAFLAYRTAYLKANFPVEFMCAVLNSEIGKAEEVTYFIKECAEMKIKVLGPDVRASNMYFTVDGQNIRFGLAAIKGVGESASSSIMQNRDKAAFKDLMDFMERTGVSLTSKVLDALCRTGALDGFGYKRSQIINSLSDLIKTASSNIKDKESGQSNFFDLLYSGDDNDAEEGSKSNLGVPDIPEFDEQEMLKNEKELLGFYVSGHPLGECSKDIDIFSTHNILELKNISGVKIRIGGMISSIEIKISKKNGSKFAILNFEDTFGNIECMVFSKAYEAYKDLLEVNKVLFLEGYIESSENDQDDAKLNSKITVYSVMSIADVKRKYTQEIHLHIQEGSTSLSTLNKIKKICEENKGEVDLIICATCVGGETAFIEANESFKIALSDNILGEFKKLLGEDSVKLKANKNVDVPTHQHKRDFSKKKPNS